MFMCVVNQKSVNKLDLTWKQSFLIRSITVWQRTIPQKIFPSRCFHPKIGGQGQKDVIGRTFPANFPKLVLIIYVLLKMSQGQSLPDLDPELINAKSL